jgi:uncharacterized FlaG/YvyC family protein
MQNEAQHDQAELDSALQAQEHAAEASSAEIGRQYSPEQVPWVNDQYTWADRQLELELMSNLLSSKLAATREELKFDMSSSSS